MRLSSWNDYIGARYGRRKTMLIWEFYRLAHATGLYEGAKSVAWADVQRVVFVCAGNICRSAYAEARAHELDLAAVSCGIDATTGTPADPTATRIAARRGLDLSTHRSCALHDLALEPGDLLVAHEPRQARLLEQQGKKAHAKTQVTLVGLWGGTGPYVGDPYGLSDEYFDNCFSIIDHALERMASHWMGGAKPPC